MPVIKINIQLPVITLKTRGNCSITISKRNFEHLDLPLSTSRISIGKFYDPELDIISPTKSHFYLDKNTTKFKIRDAESIQSLHKIRLDILNGIRNTRFIEIKSAPYVFEIYQVTKAYLNDVTTEVHWEGKALSIPQAEKFVAFNYGHHVIRLKGMSEKSFKTKIRLQDLNKLPMTELLAKASHYRIYGNQTDTNLWFFEKVV